MNMVRSAPVRPGPPMGAGRTPVSGPPRPFRGRTPPDGRPTETSEVRPTHQRADRTDRSVLDPTRTTDGSAGGPVPNGAAAMSEVLTVGANGGTPRDMALHEPHERKCRSRYAYEGLPSSRGYGVEGTSSHRGPTRPMANRENHLTRSAAKPEGLAASWRTVIGGS
jgi:hypothetical protein